MISIKKQKFMVFIPIVNISIIVITFFINSRYMKDGWRLKTYIHMFVATIIASFSQFIKNIIPNIYGSILIYYIFTVIISFTLVRCQMKYIDNELIEGKEKI